MINSKYYVFPIKHFVALLLFKTENCYKEYLGVVSSAHYSSLVLERYQIECSIDIIYSTN